MKLLRLLVIPLVGCLVSMASDASAMCSNSVSPRWQTVTKGAFVLDERRYDRIVYAPLGTWVWVTADCTVPRKRQPPMPAWRVVTRGGTRGLLYKEFTANQPTSRSVAAQIDFYAKDSTGEQQLELLGPGRGLLPIEEEREGAAQVECPISRTPCWVDAAAFGRGLARLVDPADPPAAVPPTVFSIEETPNRFTTWLRRQKVVRDSDRLQSALDKIDDLVRSAAGTCGLGVAADLETGFKAFSTGAALTLEYVIKDRDEVLRYERTKPGSPVGIHVIDRSSRLACVSGNPAYAAYVELEFISPDGKRQIEPIDRAGWTADLSQDFADPRFFQTSLIRQEGRGRLGAFRIYDYDHNYKLSTKVRDTLRELRDDPATEFDYADQHEDQLVEQAVRLIAAYPYSRTASSGGPSATASGNGND